MSMRPVYRFASIAIIRIQVIEVIIYEAVSAIVLNLIIAFSSN